MGLRRIEENTGIIISEGNRLSELVNNVLYLANLESGHDEWQAVPVSMQDVLEHSMNATRIIFQDKAACN